jgi:hypothetical protein
MTTTLRFEQTNAPDVVIHYAKLQASQEMTPDLRRFAAADTTFPRYSTTRQFLTDMQFVSLFELGKVAGQNLRAAAAPQPLDLAPGPNTG